MKEVITVLRVERYYRRLLAASLISGIGDWFSSVAILGLLLQFTESGLAIGITLAVRTLPYLVMGPIGGILADRINKKTILIISDFFRVFLALSFLFVNSSSKIWIVYVATLGLALFSALFAPARRAIIPQLVRTQHVSVANSLEQSMSGIVMVLGSALGGFVTAAFGADMAFIINALSFLVSGFLCWSIHLPQSEIDLPEKHSASTALPSFWEFFRQSRLIQIISFQAFIWPIGGGAINVLLSVYGFQEFHGGNIGVNLVWGTWSGLHH